MTIRDAFLTVYVPRTRLAEHTVKTSASHLARWEMCAGNPGVRAISPETFDTFRRESLCLRYSPDTIEGTVRLVLQVLRLLWRLGQIERVPWSGKPLRVRQNPKYVPPLSHLGLLYKNAGVARWPLHMPPGVYWRAVFTLGYYTGLRLSDLLESLLWENVGPEMIVVEARKTEKLHIYPQHPIVKRTIEGLPPVGPAVLHVPKSNKQWIREIHRINDAAGLSRHVTCQTLRRLSATQWQAAKWGAGEVIQGSAIRGSAKLYIVPQILQEAVHSLEWPDEMMSADERRKIRSSAARMLKTWKRLSDEHRAAVQALADRLCG